MRQMLISQPRKEEGSSLGVADRNCIVRITTLRTVPSFLWSVALEDLQTVSLVVVLAATPISARCAFDSQRAKVSDLERIRDILWSFLVRKK